LFPGYSELVRGFVWVGQTVLMSLRRVHTHTRVNNTTAVQLHGNPLIQTPHLQPPL
jgi:hypothetical protein